MKRFFFREFYQLRRLIDYMILSDEDLYYTSLTLLIGVVTSILIEHALFLSESPFLIPLKIIFAIVIIWGMFVGLMAASLMASGFQQQRTVNFDHLKNLLQQLFEKNWIVSIGYFLFYAFITIPLGGFGFSTVILAHIPTNVPIQNFVFANRWTVVPIFTVIYLILCYIALRLLLAIPAMVSYRCSLLDGIKMSWRLTKHKAGKMLFKILLIAVRVTIPFAIVGSLILLVLFKLNALLQSNLGSTILMILAISFIEFLFIGWFLVFMTGFLVRLSYWTSAVKLPMAKLPVFEKRTVHYHAWDLKQIKRIGLTLLGLLLLVTPTYAYFSVQMNSKHSTSVLTIAHRGVSDRNGVQNTIMSLQKTAKLNPDYVEMDIRETKDHQFVVMHDSNLMHLAGKNVAVCDLTLKQLTQITIRENGYQTKISSFSNYLKTAHQIKQPLIVEIKTSKNDTADLINLFNKKYGQSLEKHHDMVHSLNATFMTKLKKLRPGLTNGIITPFNIARIPKNATNFYSLEFHTLNRQFIQQAQAQHKKVYAWPVDGTAPMKRMLALRVDGMITNHLQRLQTVIQQQNKTNLSQYEIINNLIELW
ncbi:glycerophosphodiester phosphodiesterase [Pediococcus ethanolidurans]|uniref:glycerophosphodiester phosphodiesterase n=1 Tax=Pediococcus ethanolidurans TaxID=319653 RepID=UPI001C1ED75E|nr:glycerophosphodiester phosphodiesterase [Pediococcus ethanolidurans]MBU7562585.1 glycerophosphodiester phosphodiesterase [Pediococcus ethanolidurans]MCV3314492.1 glycerophosphodiester phosphodiesterase [Pediococcus ethanolidurans]